MQCSGGNFILEHKERDNRRRIYPTKEEAKSDMFDYIELFYNRKRPFLRNSTR